MSLHSSAKKPLILAGNGAIRKLASKHLTEFATRFNIPVVSTFMGKGAVSDRYKQSLFSIGLGFKDYVLEAVEKSDLILAVGYRSEERRVGKECRCRWGRDRVDKKVEMR